MLNEFFAVVTNTRRPRVSHPLTVEEAKDQIKKYCESEELAVIFPSSNVIQRVLSLLDVHPVSGQDIHDLYLVATMLENDVYRIYAYNTTDFAPISEVEILNPDEIEIPGAEKPDSQDQE